MKHVRPMTLGNLHLKSNIFYAPLAGCSDFPFRKMTASYNPGLIFCEMVKMDAVIRYDPGTFHILDFSHDMHPIGGQLCGAKPEIAAHAARIIEELGFDLIDLNCGCPVDKVTKDGSGSGLLKNPEKIGDIIANIVQAVKIPVTVKIRAGWDEENLVYEDIVQIAEDAGAKAICLHGRTRKQGYTGPANWEWIKRAKKASRSIYVIGNGDIFEPEDALSMFSETGCDAVLVARGTMGNPGICQDIYALDRGDTCVTSGLQEKKELLERHFRHIYHYFPDKKVVTDMRRVGCWYLKNGQNTRQIRKAITMCQTVSDVKQFLNDFPVDEPCLEPVSLVSS